MRLEKNLGNADRAVRLIVSVVIGLLFFLDIIGGPLAGALLALSFVLMLTVALSFCPVYRALGINKSEESSSNNEP